MGLFFSEMVSSWKFSPELRCFEGLFFAIDMSIDRLKGKITGKSHISWKNLWFPVDFPLSQPIEHGDSMGFTGYNSGYTQYTYTGSVLMDQQAYGERR